MLRKMDLLRPLRNYLLQSNVCKQIAINNSYDGSEYLTIPKLWDENLSGLNHVSALFILNSVFRNIYKFHIATGFQIFCPS